MVTRVRTTSLLLTLLAAHPASAQTIVLDPGHGGSDPGAVGCEGLREAPTVLDVAQRTQVLLEGAGLRAEMTRTDDRYVGLSARASYANGLGADLYVSIHSNANGGTPASGTETFVATSASSTSATMAGHLQRELIAAWRLPDRGVKRANFTVLTSTRMPAALTEIAFTNRCDPDAMLLRSPSARMEAAEAHARGVLLTLGRDPDVIGGTPTPATGVLRGVVFEDVGAGLEDTTRRIDAATVRVDGATLMVDADTGHFRFDVAAGSRTVRASAPGYAEASRTCDVTVGADTWCSVGLVREAAPIPEDAGTPPPPPADAGVAPPDDAAVELPVVEVDAGAATEPDPPIGTDRPEEVAGCSASGTRGGSTGWLLGVLGLLALVSVRRRRPSMLALLALGALGCGDVDAARAPLAPTAPRAPVEATEAAPFASIRDPRPVGPGLTAPVLSPDGARLAMTNDDLTQLWLLEGGELELVAEGPRVGYRPLFHGGALRYRHPRQSPTAIPHYAIELEVAPPPAPAPLFVRLDDEHRVLLTAPGSTPTVISPEGDRYLIPQLAADGAHVVFWGMSEGVFLHRVADARTIHLGPGGHPSFDDTGRYVVFDRTDDDGHVLTAGDLYIADTTTYAVAALTDTPDVIERAPSMARGRLAYATPEGVLLATVTLD